MASSISFHSLCIHFTYFARHQLSLMASSISSSSLVLSQQNLIFPKAHFSFQSKQPTLHFRFPIISNPLHNLKTPSTTILFAVAEETASSSIGTSSEFARRLYIGNIPRSIDNEQLTNIVQEHGAVDKAEVMYDKYTGRSRRFAFVTMKTVEDANATIEKLNGTEIDGREIKVNITEKPLTQVDLSLLLTEDSDFVDSPHKVYVGNLAKTVTTETLKNYFSEKGQVLSAKASRVPGTSKSTGFGFVTFSSKEDTKAAISSFNNSLLEGQRIRVNKA